MPVSGLVVSAADDAAADRITEQIARDRAFTLGKRIGRWLTVAVDAPDGRAAEERHQWLWRLPGVVKVDVAFVYTGEEANHVC